MINRPKNPPVSARKKMYKYINADCFQYMETMKNNSIAAIITDPPYGVKEYTHAEIKKRQSGKGGIWRIPQSFDGHQRQPVPRFTVINDDPRERQNVFDFFVKFAKLAFPVLAPGGHVFLASTPLLSDIVSSAMRQAGFERRGEIIRTVCTLRGGDRPKGAEKEFEDVSVIPRGLWEPWGLYRKPLAEKTVAENLRAWHTGALRREQPDVPFSDIIEGGKSPIAERNIINHPSLKPQAFLRKLLYASLPVGRGVIYDPLAVQHWPQRNFSHTKALARRSTRNSIKKECRQSPNLCPCIPKHYFCENGEKGGMGSPASLCL